MWIVQLALRRPYTFVIMSMLIVILGVLAILLLGTDGAQHLDAQLLTRCEILAVEGDVGAVGAFLRATAALGEQRPFGYYRISRVSDGRAVGGIGFKGPPDGGSVEIGYGLAPSARGHGYAAEALIALLAVAADHGVFTVIADTTLDNIASQRTLIRAGFRLVGTDAELHHYEALLDGPPALGYLS